MAGCERTEADHRNQSFRSDDHSNQPVTLEGFIWVHYRLLKATGNTSDWNSWEIIAVIKLKSSNFCLHNFQLQMDALHGGKSFEKTNILKSFGVTNWDGWITQNSSAACLQAITVCGRCDVNIFTCLDICPQMLFICYGLPTLYDLCILKRQTLDIMNS